MERSGGSGRGVEAELIQYMNASKPALIESINTEKRITDETHDALKEAIGEFKKTFVVEG